MSESSGDNISAIDAARVVEILGPCTDDLRDCEVLRAGFALQDVEPSNERGQAIRKELARAACQNCKRTYLSDIM